MARSVKVAVIGAGAGGLISAREFQREGHQVVVYEKGSRLGGTWAYDPRVESDPLSLDPKREIIHSSAYHSLRTNLPRHVMGFSDYPFTARKNGDPRNYPGHEEVLGFLNDFAMEFGLTELIRFDTEVVRVESRNDEWVVESRTSGLSSVDMFEAVVVCNGKHTEPRLANPPGIEKWSGKQVHSHNYRVPEPFRNQIVVLVGAGPSAFGISRDIATVAKEVHLSSRHPDVKFSKLDGYDNIWQHSKINYVNEDGTVAFEDGCSVKADVIFHCTGYKYHFPFLNTNGIVTIDDDNRVGPLYKHIFPPQLGPWLSFVGIPFMIGTIHMMELQSKWIAHVLSGKVSLPSKEEMLADVEKFYRHMEESGIPKHYTHQIYPNQFEYTDWLAAQVGIPPPEKVKRIYTQHMKFVCSSQLEVFRDEWDIDNWISSQDF
ncbi:flavin-containing monooxygenase FMO GS-OX5-like [Cornus florida]|uniref:flavin-containing monooxygenase FMO GS-OX5-like n=1 Tax=Cornus florida TaxID=4283 RepID=UPI00289E483A|nr:flavin-containing monooxygenase FMO GS-OX5-like [Cornus florida]XP_059651574.1 flavin-containing monooxygenase FMO GS-OX5-like [Cornus florida]